MNKKTGAVFVRGGILVVLAILFATGQSYKAINQDSNSIPNIVTPSKPTTPSTTSDPSPITHLKPKDPVESIEPKITSIPATQISNSRICSGNAKCFSGIVTRVIDGDTINVDGNSIRFALASAPELDEFEGEESRKLINTICPVGSTVLVDEDDGQTEGSFDRIIAMVYCNDKNLNSELLDSGLGYVSLEFCSKSEFASRSGVQKYGCQFSIESKASLESKNVKKNCDPSYPDVCIPSSPPDLDCGDVKYRMFTVLPPDPHRFDGDKNGIGCESG